MKKYVWLVLLLTALCITAAGCGNTDGSKNQAEEPPPPKQIIVLDVGHGKPSGHMTDGEKSASGYTYNNQKKSWGEWRHYKNGTFGADCMGEGCSHNGDCWYPIVNSDRDTEPEINLNNAFAAKKYLEEMGYEVRMTRETNDETPSMNKRVSYCFPENDITQTPDADLYICIHSNAGGGRGTSYIALEGGYSQSYIPDNYIELSNTAGKIINNRIAEETDLSGNAPIQNEGYLVLFNKCPVPIAYLEIGFYDNTGDLEILNTSSDAIGRAIAEGADEWFRNLQ